MIELLSLAGTISGLVTSWFQRQADLKRGELDLRMLESKQLHELKMRELDGVLLEKEYASRVYVSGIESETAIRQANYATEPQMFSNPSQTGWKGTMFAVLDFIRGMVRPGLTAYISIAQGVISVIVIRAVLGEQSLNTYALAEQCLGTLSYSMNACISHYYGTRNKASEALSRRKA